MVAERRDNCVASHQKAVYNWYEMHHSDEDVVEIYSPEWQQRITSWQFVIDRQTARIAEAKFQKLTEYFQGSKDQEVRIFEIPGLLAKHSTKALGDYGAKKNFIKEEFAIRLGLPIN
jgi:hypothetical protein